MKRALITGITGQDGSYLAELLLDRGYEVHGIVRRSSSPNTGRLEPLLSGPHGTAGRIHLHHGDLADGTVLRRIVERVEPDEVYNLGAQSHVQVSFEEPEYSLDVVALGTVRLLDSVADHARRSGRSVRIYQAGSSEMYGSAPAPQNELTPFQPRSPYAVAKVAAHWMAVTYREAYRLFICNGILFNHESPRRGETFVTRKVTRAVGRIRAGLQQTLHLGNLDARRDWGFAGDYAEAMWLMLQQDQPDDYVIATGVAHSVRDLVQLAFGLADLDWRDHVRIVPEHFRPLEVDHLLGNADKAKRKLGWEPKVGFDKLVGMMVSSDIELAQQELTLLDAGHVVAPRGATVR